MWVSHFRLWVAGPHNCPWCAGWVPLPFQKASDSPLPPKSHWFSPFTPIFTHIFPVFVLCTTTLAVFMLWASLLTPNFCSFYLSGFLWHPSDVIVLNRWLLRDAATTKNWVPSKNLSFGPSLSNYLSWCIQQIALHNSENYKNLCWKKISHGQNSQVFWENYLLVFREFFLKLMIM